MNISLSVLLAIAIRIGLLLYGTWQDATMRVKFTDVDYHVLSDGARFLTQGESPYARETYRYTPLLAAMLTPNEWIHPAFGKVCFVVADLLAGVILAHILMRRGVPSSKVPLLVALWSLNPMVFTISTRGNAESLVAVLVLGTLYLLHTRSVVAAALVYGLAVHLKPFPILYALPMYFFLDENAFPSTAAATRTLWAKLFSRPRITFAIVSACTFLGLGGLMYAWYGWDFLEGTYLYHLVRKDHRHNFSVYHYLIYLNFSETQSSIIALLSFLPQAVVLAMIGWAFYRDIAFCCFAQTFAFVAFNKVCTSQYFIWYIMFVPIIVPFSTMPMRWTGVILLALWIGSQSWWLSAAYGLEFLGTDTFDQLWMASMAFFISNVTILCITISHHTYTPVFVRGMAVPFAADLADKKRQ